MQAHDVQIWERTKELAKVCNVTFEVRDEIAFFDRHKVCLGGFYTVAEAYAFICGYEHSCHSASEVSSPAPKKRRRADTFFKR